jgi:hypothetical protein
MEDDILHHAEGAKEPGEHHLAILPQEGQAGHKNTTL